MKKILLLISLLFVVFVVNSQTNPTAATVDGYINEPAYKYWLGTTSDTLSNATADTVDIRVSGAQTYDFVIQLYSDHVSGTAVDSVFVQRSMNGSTFTALDTIASGNITADVLVSGVVTLNDFNYPYIRVIVKQTGTAVTVPYLYIFNRRN